MRKTLLIATAVLGLNAAAPAPVALAQADMIDGQVTKIDESAGKITIKHGPIKKLDMDEGMTMVFRAQRPGDAQGAQGRRQSEIRARPCERPVHGDENSEGSLAATGTSKCRAESDYIFPCFMVDM